MISRWLYSLFLGIDANFRMKRKKISSDARDPSLNEGWSFFVEETAYKAHLEKHWDQKQEVNRLCNSMFPILIELR